MITLKETENPKAIEIHFCEKLDKCERIQMDDETASLLIKLLMCKGLTRDGIPKEEIPYIVRLMERRIEKIFTYTIDFNLLLLMASLVNSPGNAVMYMWFMQYWAFKNKKSHFTIDIFCREMCSLGVFKQEDLSRLWDEQKVDCCCGLSDNLLDYSLAGESIQFIDFETRKRKQNGITNRSC